MQVWLSSSYSLIHNVHHTVPLRKILQDKEGLQFRVDGLGFRVLKSGLRSYVESSKNLNDGFMVWGLEFRVSDLGFRV